MTTLTTCYISISHRQPILWIYWIETDLFSFGKVILSAIVFLKKFNAQIKHNYFISKWCANANCATKKYCINSTNANCANKRYYIKSSNTYCATKKNYIKSANAICATQKNCIKSANARYASQKKTAKAQLKLRNCKICAICAPVYNIQSSKSLWM